MANPLLFPENTLKIHVGPLPADTTEEDLYYYFGRFGQITRVSVRPRTGSHSTTMLIQSSCTIEAANLATVQKIFGAEHIFRQRKLKCTKFMEGEELAEYNRESNERRVMVKNIPSYVTFDWLKSIVEPFGEIDFLYFIQGKYNPAARYKNKKCQTASIQFAFKKGAAKIVAAKYHQLGNTKIKFQVYNHNHNNPRTAPFRQTSGPEDMYVANPDNKFEYEEKKLEQVTPHLKTVKSSKGIDHYLKPTNQLYFMPERKQKLGFYHSPLLNMRFNIKVTEDPEIIVNRETRRVQ